MAGAMMRIHVNSIAVLAIVAGAIVAVGGAASVENVAGAIESTCLNLGTQDIDFGEVTDDDWDNWTGIELDFASNEEFLQVTNSDGQSALRQRLVPSSQGSARVTVRGDLQASPTYTISQRVFFEPGFDWGRDNQGGKLGFGLGGGTSPTGGDVDPAGFSARFMWRGNGDGTARIALYSYASDRTQNLPYGDDYDLEGFTAPIGRWFDLTMEVTANSAHGEADGRVRAWADGELALDRTGVLWQDAGGSPMVDTFIFATFYGGNGWDWAPESTTHIRFADVCWNASARDAPPTLGDVNCDGVVTKIDAQALLEYAVGARSAVSSCPLSGQVAQLNTALADVSGDGDIAVNDALLIMQGV